MPYVTFVERDNRHVRVRTAIGEDRGALGFRVVENRLSLDERVRYLIERKRIPAHTDMHTITFVFSLEDEGRTWIRGKHAPNSEGVKALLATYALSQLP